MTATIIDYLRWRGDLSFAERAFNAVDNLVLAEFCYLNFDGLVPDPASGDRVKLTTVAEQYLAQERGKDQGLQAHPDLLPPMINFNRFGNLWLSKYVNIVSDDADIQFCAFHIDIDEQTTYVAFRGTDETLVGWREDFMLSYEIVPAQRAAGQYLNQTVEIERNYLLGGHSKGGNLATYAMLELASSKQQLVEKVYSNDGPGIPQEHLDEQRFAAIRPKVLKIVPDSSLVGMLFHNGEETVVVASNKVDLAQHDGITWQVDAAEFQTVSELKPAAQRRNAVITEWINDAPRSERIAITRDVFESLSAGGAETVLDLPDSNPSQVRRILARVRRSGPKTRQLLDDLLGRTLRTRNDARVRRFQQRRPRIRRRSK